TTFHIVKEEPVQKIHETVTIQIEYNEVGETRKGDGHPREDANETSAKIIQTFIKPFEMTKPPLFRVGLTKIAENKHIFALDIHHIITDGTSMQLMIKEYLALYNGDTLSAMTHQYKDYTQWQNKEKEAEAHQKARDYWKNEFSGELPVLELPTDNTRPANLTFTGGSVHFQQGEEDT
ncbi:MAG: hypothetical protein GY757_48195, partial [bacterium]|nr:hypothetical protein [bacterium]